MYIKHMLMPFHLMMWKTKLWAVITYFVSGLRRDDFFQFYSHTGT